MSDPELTKIVFPLEWDDDDYPPFSTESIHAQRVENGWRVDNVPWFTREVALHDVVTTEDHEGSPTFHTEASETGYLADEHVVRWPA